ncbi:hypothetical protein [Nostoc commune]|uniref:hypothetical protein n=1 Tax=Nostoc commune TaxID=1178 RepID=UPI0018C623D6|nr:hypothetical protein [Nostoc commune]MBG1259776.1 hypothetical protein [Nostoc commune BAE]
MELSRHRGETNAQQRLTAYYTGQNDFERMTTSAIRGLGESQQSKISDRRVIDCPVDILDTSTGHSYDSRN